MFQKNQRAKPTSKSVTFTVLTNLISILQMVLLSRSLYTSQNSSHYFCIGSGAACDRIRHFIGGRRESESNMHSVSRRTVTFQPTTVLFLVFLCTFLSQPTESRMNDAPNSVSRASTERMSVLLRFHKPWTFVR